MGVVLGKHPELVLYARAVARALTVDDAGEKRRVPESGSEYLVHLLVGMENIAFHLIAIFLDGGRNVEEGEAVGLLVSELDGKGGGNYRSNVDAGRGAGLHTTGSQAELHELVRQSIGRFLPYPSSFRNIAADEDLAAEEGPGGQNKRPRLENRPCIRADSADF